MNKDHPIAVFTWNTGDLRHPNSVFSFLWIMEWQVFSAAFDKTVELQLWLEPNSDFNDPIASPTPAKGLFSMPKNCDPFLFQIRLNWTGLQTCKV
jgi:hypothetical protein